MDLEALKARLGTRWDYQLADQLDVPHTLISDIRAGRRKVSWKMRAKAAALTGDQSYIKQAV